MSTPSLPPCSTTPLARPSSKSRVIGYCSRRCQSAAPPGRRGSRTAPPSGSCGLSCFHANLIPRIGDGFCLVAGGAVATFGIGHGTPGKGSETRRSPEVPIADRVVPDLSGLDPCIPAQRRRNQVEGAIGYARVDVDPAIILGGVDIMLHVGRLRILSEYIVIVRGAWSLHR